MLLMEGSGGSANGLYFSRLFADGKIEDCFREKLSERTHPILPHQERTDG
jgi:hypothetical protein